MKDLWPESLTDVSDLRAPVTVLREQASLLGQKTRNLLTGEVARPKVPTDKFVYQFIIHSRTIEYSYHLLTITNDMNLYPVTITVSEETRKHVLSEIGNPLVDDPPRGLIAGDEEEFLNILEQVLGAPQTVKVVKSILAQIKRP
ncbi:MAG TPA: hypothetical protein VGJ94_16020 [Syntrophorhabdaceae bacterium]|jgi:hypothetical protein